MENQTSIQQQNSNNSFNNVLAQESKALNNIFKKVGDSVVELLVDFGKVPGSQYHLFGSGSGFIYNTEGYVITNNHVVNGSIGGRVDVTFNDQNTYTAKVVGTDVYDDIAVLQIIDDFSQEHVVPLTFANSSKLDIGQIVIAVGNPSGLRNTMTMGIVSQVGRLLPSINASGGIIAQTDVIQTDAAINHGNSGGPLLNVDGQVVGMTFGGERNATGLNFAIPSNLLLRIVPALIQTGHYDHPSLGFSGASLTPIDAENMGLPRSFKGVMIFSVTTGGPLDKVGIKPQDPNPGGYRGDIIEKVDGHTVKNMEDLLVYLEEHKSPGQNITITIDRNGQQTDLNTILQARPKL